MTKVRVLRLFGLVLHGFGAGPGQSLENPLGKRGSEFRTRTFLIVDKSGWRQKEIDEDFEHRSMDGFGAFILGRNMFGPIRGPWPDETKRAGGADNPPYHAPTFVLTHHPRDPIKMEGGDYVHLCDRGY